MLVRLGLLLVWSLRRWLLLLPHGRLLLLLPHGRLLLPHGLLLLLPHGRLLLLSRWGGCCPRRMHGGRKFGNGCVQASGRPVSLFFGSEIAAS